MRYVMLRPSAHLSITDHLSTMETVMSTKNASTSSPNPTKPGTIAELREAMLADGTVDPRRRQEVASALRRLAKALCKPAEMIPTAPAALRPMLANFPAVRAGLSAGRWRNIRGLTQFALAHFGLATVPVRSRQALSPAWDALLGDVPAYSERYKLGRLGRYCSGVGVEPEGVGDQVMDGYLTDLRDRSLVSNPERLHRDAAVIWNRRATANMPWPRTLLCVPDNRDTYALPWTSFPASLKADVDAWLDWLGGTDPTIERDADPLKSASLRTRKRQIHLFVSAIGLSGLDTAELRTLADVVAPARAIAGFTFFWQRNGKTPSAHTSQMFSLACAIAKHWAKLGKDDLEQINKVKKRMVPKMEGMTQRNHDRLRPLRDPLLMHKLLTLPSAIREEVLRAGVPTTSLALQLQTALSIELLLAVPIRIKNLAGLRVGTHILIGRRGDVTLIVPKDEVKNGVPAEAQLPDNAVDLLDLYLTHYRPLLGDSASDWLFPGHTEAGAKGCEGLRQAIKTCLLSRCGLEWNPHLFRHLAAMIILTAHPGAHRHVQTILGHKSITTTMQFYAGMEKPAAFAHYSKLVSTLSDEALLPIPKGRTKRPGPKRPRARPPENRAGHPSDGPTDRNTSPAPSNGKRS